MILLLLPKMLCKSLLFWVWDQSGLWLISQSSSTLSCAVLYNTNSCVFSVNCAKCVMKLIDWLIDWECAFYQWTMVDWIYHLWFWYNMHNSFFFFNEITKVIMTCGPLFWLNLLIISIQLNQFCEFFSFLKGEIFTVFNLINIHEHNLHDLNICIFVYF